MKRVPPSRPIFDEILAIGPVSAEVGYGALVVTSESVFDSRKLEMAPAVGFEFDV